MEKCANIKENRIKGCNMYEKQSKNTLILDILQILEKYSDVNHRLTQNDIISLLKSEFDMDVERKSIVRNINNLIEAGYDISYDEKSNGIDLRGREMRGSGEARTGAAREKQGQEPNRQAMV